jgi:hypothetical protein
MQLIAQGVEQSFLWLAQEFDGVPVDGCGDMVLRHQPFLARS